MALLPLEDAKEAILARVREVRGENGPSSIWPSEFSDTPEGAYQFVLKQWTWNEAESEEQPFPDKEFLWDYCNEWHTSLRLGRMLVTEKCRRMVISWCARALELHQMGLRRTDCILVGEDLEQAAKHVWRLEFLYAGLARRNPDWNLPPYRHLRYEGDRKLKMFGLANGSITNYANGQSSGLQGDGVKIITMEEFGLYRYASAMLAQAKIITKGSANSTGGFVNLITNASTNPQWKIVKRGRVPVED